MTSPDRPPTHYATGLPGVQLFREHSSRHHYRVWHEDWYALCVVETGAGEVRYRGRTLTLAPASVAVFEPGNAHETRRILQIGAYWVLLLPASQVNKRAEAHGRQALQLLPEVWTDGHMVALASRFCTALADPTTPLIERELLYLQLLDCLNERDVRASVEPSVTEEPELGLVRRVREHLVNRPLDCNTSLASVAKDIGCSSAYLSKAFSVSQACPPKTLLRLVRVERGRQFLVATEGAQIKEAGLQAGFRSYEKFNRAFHDVWNLSPSAYLSQFQEATRRIDHARQHLA